MNINKKLTIHELDGAVIHYDDVAKYFPTRKDFLDQTLVKTVQDRIIKKQTLRFRSDHLFEKYLLVKDGEYDTCKYSKRYYCIILSGVLEDGRHQTVVITGIKPYFEIRVPKEYDINQSEEMMLEVKKYFSDKGTKYHAVELNEGKDMPGGYGYNTRFIKCSFNTETARKWSMKQIMEDQHKWRTRHNDMSCYYRVVLRDLSLPITGWCNIKKYGIENSGTIPFIRAKTIIMVDYNDIEKCHDDPIEDPILKKNPGLGVYWDGEMGSGSGELPDPMNLEDDLFMIGMNYISHQSKIFPTDSDPVTDIPNGTYTYPKPKGHIINICFTTVPVPAMKNRCIIYCRSEKQMLIAIAIIWGKLRPEYEISFNGFNFDWNWVYIRGKQLGLLPYFEKLMSIIDFSKYNEYITNYKTFPHSAYHWKTFRFKISADMNVTGDYLQFPGYISIDTKPQMRKYYRNPEKNSLNNYLKIAKLGQKADLPIRLMFVIYKSMKAFKETYLITHELNLYGYDNDFVLDIFRAAGFPELALRYENLLYAMIFIAEYCFIDGIKCNDLLSSTNFLTDRRAQGELGFVSMEDAINRADGMQVINLLFNDAGKDNYKVNAMMGKKIDFKYPGAKVFEPFRKEIKPRLNIQERIQRAKNGDQKFVEWLKYDTVSEFEDWIFNNDAWIGYMLKDDNTIEDLRDNHSKLNLFKDEKQAIELFAFPQCFVEMIFEYPDTGETALDFNSLYPSIIMEQNLSMEKKITEAIDALKYKKEGIPINTVDLCFNNQMKIKAWMRHHEMTEFTDSQEHFGIYPRVLRRLFVDRKKIKALMKPVVKRVEHLEDIIMSKKGKSKKKKKVIVFDIHKYRKDLIAKKEDKNEIWTEWDEWELKKFIQDTIDDIEKEKQKILDQLEKDKTSKIVKDVDKSIEDLEEELDENTLKMNYLDAKQKALKVFMNTFYGKAGESGSPLFDLSVAAGTTMRGRELLVILSKWLTEFKGATLLYGDTDSCYFMFNQRYFRNIHRAYYSGRITKLTYMRQIINLCIVLSKEYEKEVNKYFVKMTGGPFIRVAWEEVGYPSIHMGKKKYVMIPHESYYPVGMTDEDFYEKFLSLKLFIRGIEIKKKGNSQLLQDIGRDVWKKSFDPMCTDQLLDVVTNKIKEVYTASDRKDSDFIMTAAYKPNKQNPTVQLFVKRMQPLGLEPEAFERFRYVMVQKYPYAYDIKGRKRKLKVGERMEYPDRAKKLGEKIDMDYYMTGKIKGELSRYIRYHPSLHIQPKDTNNDVECHDCDSKSVDAAKKYIDNICAKYSANWVDKGAIHKLLYKETHKRLTPHLERRGWNSKMTIFNSDTTEQSKKNQKSVYDKTIMGKKSNDEIFERFVTSAEKLAMKNAERSAKLNVTNMSKVKGQLYVSSRKKTDQPSTKILFANTKIYNKSERLSKIVRLIRSYEYLHEMRFSIYEVVKNHIYGDVRKHMKKFRQILDQRDEIIQNTIDKLIEQHNIDEISEASTDDLLEHMETIKESLGSDINSFIPEELDDINEDEMKIDIINELWTKLQIYSTSYFEAKYTLELLQKKKKSCLGIF
jgi:DNA polymerase elongation subunit (family B)